MEASGAVGVLAPVANEPVKPFQRLVVIAAVAFVGDRNVFVGVNVMKRERPGVAIGNRVLQPIVTKQYQQGGKPRALPGP